jgi:hypothetical protein
MVYLVKYRDFIFTLKITLAAEWLLDPQSGEQR